MFPDTHRVVLSGSPQMQAHKSDTILQGGLITWLRDQQQIQVDPPADAPNAPGRVRVSLPPLGSGQPDAPARGANDSERLIITGKSLRAQFGTNQPRFDVEKSVEVVDPQNMTVEADHLDAEFDSPAPASANVTAGDEVAVVSQLGKLNHLAMTGNVTIWQDGLTTTTPRAEILPAQNEILLSGGPQVVDTQSSAVMNGDRITISRDGQSASVRGSAEHPAKLHLPTMPGLGGVLGPSVDTTVTSDQVDVQRLTDKSIFTFQGNVAATASDLGLTCRTLEVDTNNAPPQPGVDPLSPDAQFDKIQKLVASDHVEITQNDYHAHAATAVIFPRASVTGEQADAGATTEAKSYRAVQLSGDPQGVTGPLRPEVELPPLQGVTLGATPTGNLTVNPNTTPTKITSDKQWLLSSPTDNTYYFEDNVQIDAGILQATCDKMRAFGSPSPEANPATPGAAKLTLERILADGQMRIVQDTTVSTADHAEILPNHKPPIATLSGNVVVVDSTRHTNLKNADVIIHLDTHQAEAVTPPAQPGQKAQRPTFEMETGANNFDNLMKPGDKPAAGTSP
jgi:lipopolysaccharide export system protein LptA